MKREAKSVFGRNGHGELTSVWGLNDPWTAVGLVAFWFIFPPVVGFAAVLWFIRAQLRRRELNRANTEGYSIMGEAMEGTWGLYSEELVERALDEWV